MLGSFPGIFHWVVGAERSNSIHCDLQHISDKNRREYNLSGIVLYNNKKLHDIFTFISSYKKSFAIQYILVNIFTQVTATAEPFSVIL